MLTTTLKELRKQHNMSQIDLAINLGVSQNTISSWETGRTEPDNKTLIQLSKQFHVSIDILLKNNFDDVYNLSRMTLNLDIGLRAKTIRNAFEIDLEELAKKLSLPRSVLTDFETHASAINLPSTYIELIKEICNYYKISPSAFFDQNISAEEMRLNTTIKDLSNNQLKLLIELTKNLK